MLFLNKLKEVFLSSLPLAAIIIIVCGFVAPLTNPYDYVKLTIGYISVVIGQTLFLKGLDISIIPIGKRVGGSLVKIKNIAAILIIGLVFGLLATVAEPALTVLAKQAHMTLNIINETAFIWILSLGTGVFVAFALFRIIRNLNIKIVFAVLYILIFALIAVVPEEFIALAFDGSGATTGDVSVPFILALGLGASATLTKSKANDDTFGIIGLASVGPIIAVFIYGIILKAANGGVIPPAGNYDPGAANDIAEIILSNLQGVAMALLPIIAVFIPFQFFLLKLTKKEISGIALGLIEVFAGLLIFLTGIDYGFAFAGKYIGEIFLSAGRPDWFRWLLLPVAFFLGGAITLSEPAVTVLGEQLESITNGHIKKTTIRITLAIGIGFAAVLSIVKILTQINILWFLAPLYAVALILMIFSSKLFVGLAFDSGGVTGGALTSAFLTPLTLGAAQAVAAEAGSSAQSVLTNGFGIIAFISVTPLIAVQMLGIIYNIRVRKQVERSNYAQQHQLLELEDLAELTESENDSLDETNSQLIENVSDKESHSLSDTASHKLSDDVSSGVSDDVPCDVPDNVSDNVPGNVPDSFDSVTENTSNMVSDAVIKKPAINEKNDFSDGNSVKKSKKTRKPKSKQKKRDKNE